MDTAQVLDGTAKRPRWNRVVLKLSGEALAEPTGFGLDTNVLHQVATEIHEVQTVLVESLDTPG